MRLFASHCLLDYPEYEVLFGVNDPQRSGAIAGGEIARGISPEEFAESCIVRKRWGLNGKVSNLAQMLPQARYEHIIINDSDILVERDYLSRVMAPFAKPGVGMVTTLYRVVWPAKPWARSWRHSASAPTLPAVC